MENKDKATARPPGAVRPRPAEGSGKSEADRQREARLRGALRDNLKRRKQQERDREDGQEG